MLRFVLVFAFQPCCRCEYELGWFIHSLCNRSACGRFIVKFIGYDARYCLTLEMEDYDADDIWVLIKKK